MGNRMSEVFIFGVVIPIGGCVLAWWTVLLKRAAQDAICAALNSAASDIR
jgi:hypothetical protein